MTKLLSIIAFLFCFNVSGQFIIDSYRYAGCTTVYETANAINICNEEDDTDGFTNQTGTDITIATNGNADTGTRAVNLLITTATGVNEITTIDMIGVNDTENVTISFRVAVGQGSQCRPRLPLSRGWSSTVAGSNFSGGSYATYNITGTATQNDPKMEIQFQSGHASGDNIDIDTLEWTVN